MKIISLLHVPVFICINTAFAVLTPTEQYVCPRATVTYACEINQYQTTLLKWSITYVEQSITPIREIFIAGEDNPGISRTQTNNVGQLFNFSLLSLSPHHMNSTLLAVIKDNPEYSRLMIKCNNGSSIYTHLDMSTTYIITQVPAPTSNISVNIEENQESGAVARISWNDGLFTFQYSVLVLSNQVSSITTTNNNWVKLLLLYNSDYNISVVATNCRGSSNPVSILLTVAHCTHPIVGPDVTVEGYTDGSIGSQINYRCQFRQEPNESVISTCSTGGIWNPNPAEHKCKVDSVLKHACGIPTVQTNVIIKPTLNLTVGSEVAYYCKDHNNSTATSICFEGGNWIPDPAEYYCEIISKSRDFFDFTSPTGIAVVVSVVVLLGLCMTIMGVIIFIAILKTSQFRKSQRGDSLSVREVVYDEILTEVWPKQVTLNNTAYGEPGKVVDE